MTRSKSFQLELAASGPKYPSTCLRLVPLPGKMPGRILDGEFPVKHRPAGFRNRCGARAAQTAAPGKTLLHQTAFAPAAFTEAAQLIERFGEYAGSEAALRAGRSRDLGNFVHFCRWREVGRMIELMRDEAVTGPVH